ncbi:hypothetical protein, partial [Streptomyces sp. H27-C3]|uniref:hypothetical protein n=1 Tax=Streptomyces sp. H27-C3 TaxID=3046305 RepID=UPI0024B934F3
ACTPPSTTSHPKNSRPSTTEPRRPRTPPETTQTGRYETQGSSIANYDLFNEYDRAVGEAEFRKNVAYALVGLTAALSWLESPWWALLLVLSVRLYVAGVGSERSANDVLIQAVVAGLVLPGALSGAAGVPAVPARRSQ